MILSSAYKVLFVEQFRNAIFPFKCDYKALDSNITVNFWRIEVYSKFVCSIVPPRDIVACKRAFDKFVPSLTPCAARVFDIADRAASHIIIVSIRARGKNSSSVCSRDCRASFQLLSSQQYMEIADKTGISYRL